ncbi:hypothetical protein [Streptomyces rubiginosohelvolus]|uniref:hypothetical protein n=1 Tax=Streptomyces rubiginosohelvolus TaxID=67362 RepID=UPI0035E0E3A8
MEIDPIAIASASLIAQAFLGEAGRSAWSGAGRMISSVRNRFSGTQTATATLAVVQQDPNDAQAVDDLALLISSGMQRDMQFRELMESFIEEAIAHGEVPRQVRNYTDLRNAKVGKVVNVDTVNGDLNF